MLTLSHYLEAALDMGMEGRQVQLNFSATFDRASHCGLLHKLRSICVGGQFLPIVSEFLTDRKQRVLLEGKVSASVDVVLGMTQDSALGPLLFILFTSELFHIDGYHDVRYADNTR